MDGQVREHTHTSEYAGGEIVCQRFWLPSNIALMKLYLLLMDRSWWYSCSSADIMVTILQYYVNTHNLG